MGFLDKIKGAVSAVTGGGAKVTLEFRPPFAMPGEPVQVRVTATSTGGEIKSKGLYIDLRAVETVRVDKDEVAGAERDVNCSRETFTQEIAISPAFVLAPNETKTFEGVVNLPANCQPSFTGKLTQHEWTIRGRVEAFGNDPDSGYQPLRVGLRS